jgi:hypothetical protein
MCPIKQPHNRIFLELRKNAKTKVVKNENLGLLHGNAMQKKVWIFASFYKIHCWKFKNNPKEIGIFVIAKFKIAKLFFPIIGQK